MFARLLSTLGSAETVIAFVRLNSLVDPNPEVVPPSMAVVVADRTLPVRSVPVGRVMFAVWLIPGETVVEPK